MITRIRVQKRQEFISCRGIHDLANARQGVLIFRACFIQTCIISTHASGPIGFFYKNRVCYPARIIYWPDEPSFK
jgi:hypothetical protein